MHSFSNSASQDSVHDRDMFLGDPQRCCITNALSTTTELFFPFFPDKIEIERQLCEMPDVSTRPSSKGTTLRTCDRLPPHVTKALSRRHRGCAAGPAARRPPPSQLRTPTGHPNACAKPARPGPTGSRKPASAQTSTHQPPQPAQRALPCHVVPPIRGMW